MKSHLKILLTKLGRHASPKIIEGVNSTLNYLAAGRWFQTHGYSTVRRFKDRYELFDSVGRQIFGEDVLYLEFGVWRGEATKYWSNILKNPKSVLHGFDSFEGLPEDWNQTEKSFFSTEGQIPEISDLRVKFFKGWFEETLPKYDFQPHERLFLNMDADLYSSTKYVLSQLRDQIPVGSYIYFDEFNDRLHEMKAFDEFLGETKMRFNLIGTNELLSNVIFQRIG